MSHNWPFQVQSFLILGLIWVGIYFRRKRSRHIRIMISAIILDILLILQIEFFRNAIDKASKVLHNPFMLNLHVSLAITTVLVYFLMIFTGRKILKAKPGQWRKYHRNLGWSAVTLRTVTLITSFFT